MLLKFCFWGGMLLCNSVGLEFLSSSNHCLTLSCSWDCKCILQWVFGPFTFIALKFLSVKSHTFHSLWVRFYILLLLSMGHTFIKYFACFIVFVGDWTLFIMSHKTCRLEFSPKKGVKEWGPFLHPSSLLPSFLTFFSFLLVSLFFS